MKKVISILLSLLLMCSLTACKSNEIEYELVEYRLETTYGQKLNGELGDTSEFTLKADLDKGVLIYGRGEKTYTAKLSNPKEIGGCTVYDVEWDKTPEIVEGFKVVDSSVQVVNEPTYVEKELDIQMFLEGKISGINIELILTEFWI